MRLSEAASAVPSVSGVKAEASADHWLRPPLTGQVPSTWLPASAREGVVSAAAPGLETVPQPVAAGEAAGPSAAAATSAPSTAHRPAARRRHRRRRIASQAIARTPLEDCPRPPLALRRYALRGGSANHSSAVQALQIALSLTGQRAIMTTRAASGS